MSLKKIISAVFTILGSLCCLAAFIAAGFSITALFERAQHGRGIMFADVEFLALAALALLVPGIALLYAGRKLKK